MSQLLNTWTVAVLAALTCGLPASAGDKSDEAAAPSVKNLRLKVSPNGRFFEDQNGKPFFYLADTCWLLFQRLDHDELDAYLEDRLAKGFGAVKSTLARFGRTPPKHSPRVGPQPTDLIGPKLLP